MSEHGQGHVSRLCAMALRAGCPYPLGEVLAALRVLGSLAMSHWGRCTWQGCNVTEVAIKEQDEDILLVSHDKGTGFAS